MKTIYIDCSFVSEHPELNTGIQRVVRNIVSNIKEVADTSKVSIIPVDISGGKLQPVDLTQKKVKADTTKEKSFDISKIKQQLKNYIKNIYKASRDLLIAIFPHPKLRNFLYAPKDTFGFRYIVERLFIRPIKGFQKPVDSLSEVSQERFKKDDILLLLDSTWHLSIWETVAEAKRSGAKVYAVVYDIIPISHPQFCDDSLVVLFKRWFERSIDYVDRYIAISNTVKNDLKEYLQKNYPEKVKDKEFDYFLLGSDFTSLKKPKKVKDDIKKIFKAGSTYLIVSTIEPRKNHTYLLDVFDRLWKDGLDVKLCMVGKIGWKIEALLQRIQNHPEYNKKLFLLSGLSDDELRYCYEQAKMLLFPSFVEGFGLPIIESLANSLPVLASDTPIHKEVGKDNIGYFDINDPNNLVEKIKDIEKNGIPQKLLVKDSMNIVTWKQSAKELLGKIV